MHRPRVHLYFALLIGSAWSADAAEPIELRLRSSVVCQATVVRLSDIAEIHPADSDRSRAMAAIAILPAPAGGSSRELTQHEVRQLLSLSGVEGREFIVTGSEAIVLQTDAATPIEVRPVARALRSTSDIRPAAAELEIVPAEQRDLRPQLYAERPKEPRLPLPAPPRLIERGETVKIHSLAAGVRITAGGKSLGHGAMGDVIPIELEGSKDRILAKIVAPQLVEVATDTTAQTPGGSRLPALPTAQR